MFPLVTILIATKDRPDELRRTLRTLREQRYPNIEFLVIDDGSRPNLRSIVLEEAPAATYIYQEKCAGQSKRRSEGLKLAKGQYILQLDDDSYPVNPEAIDQAVQVMQKRPEIGILSFYIFNGEKLPKELSIPSAKYPNSFVGCGALFRSIASAKTAGYREFFGNEWEEEEFSLQVLKAGFAIYFFPDIVIHHHVSPRNRLADRTWRRGFRNKLWAIVMHFPARRLPLEMTWVLAIATFDALRLLRFRSFVQGLVEFVSGFPRVVSLREPMSDIVLRRYDAMRFGGIRTLEVFHDPSPLAPRDVLKWFRAWWKRPRQRSFWDARSGDVGTSETVTFQHEFVASRREPRP